MLRIPIRNKRCYLPNKTVALANENSSVTARFELENAQGDLLLSSLYFSLHTVNAKGHEEVYTYLTKTVNGNTLCIDFPITWAVTGAAGAFRFELLFASDASMNNIVYRVYEDYFNIASTMDDVAFSDPTVLTQVTTLAGQVSDNADAVSVSAAKAQKSADVASNAQNSVAALYPMIVSAASSASASAATATTKAAEASGDAAIAQAASESAQDYASQASVIAVKLPKLLTSGGNWQLYNTETEQYEDSGKPSRGLAGTTHYLYIKYSAVANPANTDMSDTPAKYIGTCVSTAVSAPTTAASYAWCQFIGDNGTNGTNGTNGSSCYLHIRYSDVSSPTDSDMVTTPAKYIGTATTTSSTAPTTAASYTWCQFIGDNGTGSGDMAKSVYDTDNSGTVDSADKLTTARTINGVPFDGSANITVAAAPTAHKSTHASGGSDALSALEIGAAPHFHAHGNITSAGAIGSTTDLAVFTGASGVLTAKTIAQAKTILGYADSVHSHVVADVTDFPASLPASDVYSWAKASAKPPYTNTEVGAAATTHASQHASNGSDPITPSAIGAAASSHAHGYLTNVGKIGSAEGLPVFTASGGYINTTTVANARTLLDARQNIAVITDTATTYTITTLADNTQYMLGTLTSLTISAYPTGNYDALVCFTAGTGGISVSLPTTVWNGGTAPTFTAGKYYELSIRNGYGCYGKY